MLLLGTRGQGKTRLLRQLVDLLDEAVPALAGCELRDDPLAPVSAAGRRLLADAATTPRSSGSAATSGTARSWPRRT